MGVQKVCGMRKLLNEEYTEEFDCNSDSYGWNLVTDKHFVYCVVLELYYNIGLRTLLFFCFQSANP